MRSHQTSNKIVIFYHANCSDGFGGAYAAWKKFGSKAEYIALQHGNSLPLLPKESDVYFIDIVPSEKELTALMRAPARRNFSEGGNRRITAIDHHVTAESLVKRTEGYLYALNHSGATLAWKYFHGIKKIPRLLLHIEDGDLWRHKLPGTKEIYAILESLPFNFKVWDKLAREFENLKERKKIIERGRGLLIYKNKLITDIVESGAHLVTFKGIKTLAVNSPIFQSEIGNKLTLLYPPMGIVWYEGKDGRKFSLRSAQSFDVSKLAAKFGGGGHKQAAGFTMDTKKPLPWKRL